MNENVLRSYKTGLVPLINFYSTRIKEPVIITRLMKSSSNLLIFLGCFVCVCVLFRVDFTHLVLSLLAVVPVRFQFQTGLSVFNDHE